MSPHSRSRRIMHNVNPTLILYEIATVGGEQLHHAVTLYTNLCGRRLYRRSLRIGGDTVTCQRCLVRIARNPVRYHHLTH